MCNRTHAWYALLLILMCSGCQTTTVSPTSSEQARTSPPNVDQCDAVGPSIKNFEAVLEATVQGIVDNTGTRVRLIESATSSSSTLYASYSTYYLCVIRVLGQSSDTDIALTRIQASLASYFSDLNAVTISDDDAEAKLGKVRDIRERFFNDVVESASTDRFGPIDRRVLASFPNQPVDTTLRAVDLQVNVTIRQDDVASLCAGTAQTLAQPVNGATLVLLQKLHPGFESIATGNLSPYIFLAEQSILMARVAEDYAENINPANLSFDGCAKES